MSKRKNKSYHVSDDYSTRQNMHQEYLRSPAWHNFRNKILKQRGFVCEKCGEYGSDIHHLTYKRWGRERPSDVQVLCRQCHDATHSIHRSQPRRKVTKQKPVLTFVGLAKYLTPKQLDNCSQQLNMTPKEIKTAILCQNYSISFKVAEVIGVKLLKPRPAKQKKKSIAISRYRNNPPFN